MKISAKDRKTWLLVLAGIFENLAAAWFAHILISPGFSQAFGIDELLVLTRSGFLGIVFTVASFSLFRRIR